MGLQLLQTIIYIALWFFGLWLVLGVIGLIGALTSLLHFNEGDVTKLMVFDVVMLAAVFVLKWAFRKLRSYRFGVK